MTSAAGPSSALPEDPAGSAANLPAGDVRPPGYDSLFVFVGAGVSRAAPTALPTFNEIRDHILCGLQLNSYVAEEPGADPQLVRIAEGMFPERFLLALADSGFELESWLNAVLGRVRPNAAHVVLAQLAAAGAKVWTVNYDHNIEAAAESPLDVVAWPAKPDGVGILKPHGTLGGKLIATAEQVVLGLEAPWLEQLQRDLHGRSTVIFLGYSGRDLDFHPYWDELLAGAEQVLWFDFPDPVGQDFKRTLLSETARRGALSFPEPIPPPTAALATAAINPCWDFISWCRANGLTNLSVERAASLFAKSEPPDRVPLRGDLIWARAALLGALGAYPEQRRTYLGLLIKPRSTAAALRALAVHEVNHGSRAVEWVLAGGRLLPPIGSRLTDWKEYAERKRLTVLSRVGDHSRVVAATNKLRADSVSTYKILRAEALRLVGSLAEAVEVADEAYHQALSERHNVRIAHAAYQKAQALVWSDRIDEARHVLDNELDPHAALAASRWVAWASFLRSAILVRTGDLERCAEQVRLSVQRFSGEALLDGVVSAELVLLTLARRAADDDGFHHALDGVRRSIGNSDRRDVYYTRGHPFTQEAILLEEAEFARTHTDDLPRATQLYAQLAGSVYPLHQAFGHLGLSLTMPDERSKHLVPAETIARRIGQQLVIERCGLLAEDSPASFAEIFFC